MILFGIILGAFMTLVVYGAYILLIAFTLWMAVDAAKQDRFGWVVLIVGIPIIGGGVYYFTEKKHEYAKIESHHIHTSQTEAEHEKAPSDYHHHRKTDVIEENSSTQEVVTEEKKEEVKA
jgi:uncharacterized membrane protein (DUF485 family)